MNIARSFGLIVFLLVWGQANAVQDPTRPPHAGEPTANPAPLRTLSLDSIVYGEGRRVAVIDGRPMREGETVNGVRVKAIHSDRVEVLDHGHKRVLRLEPLPGVRVSR